MFGVTHRDVRNPELQRNFGESDGDIAYQAHTTCSPWSRHIPGTILSNPYHSPLMIPQWQTRKMRLREVVSQDHRAQKEGIQGSHTAPKTELKLDTAPEA